MFSIEVNNLEKYFGEFHALRKVNFGVEPGQIIGFIGPNGAGKTTTMRILATLETPDAGEAFVEGVSCIHFPDVVRQKIGFMPDYYGTYPHTTVYEYLDFFARAHGLKGEEKNQRLESIIQYTELGPLAEKPIDGLSKGMKQRVSLGRTLVHDPSIMILDEPAAGLDPKARIDLRNLLKLFCKKMGKTILISSHILTELSEICDSVIFIENGRVQKSGKIQSLIDEVDSRHTAGRWLSISLLEPNPALIPFLLEQPGVLDVDNREHRILCHFEGGRGPQGLLLNHLIQKGFPVVEFGAVQKNLEDVFLDLAGSGEQENAH